MSKTNFDIFLEDQLRDPDFAEHFKRAGEAWDVAIQLAALREKAGLSQNELARRLHTSQQQISRMESPAYEGHSLSMLRRVAHELKAQVKVTIEPLEATGAIGFQSRAGRYGGGTQQPTKWRELPAPVPESASRMLPPPSNPPSHPNSASRSFGMNRGVGICSSQTNASICPDADKPAYLRP